MTSLTLIIISSPLKTFKISFEYDALIMLVLYMAAIPKEWKKNFHRLRPDTSLSIQNASSETQGQIAGARGSLNERKKMATKKSIVRREESLGLGTRSYQTSSKQSGKRL